MNLRLVFLFILGLLVSCSVAFPTPFEDEYAETDRTFEDARKKSESARPLPFRREPATLNTVRRLAERRQAEIMENMDDAQVAVGTVSWKPAKSCAAIKKNSPKLPSGIYYISYKEEDEDKVQIFRTYCQMTIDGGAWTFIPRRAVVKGTGNRGLIKQLFTKKKEVLLLIHQPGYGQKQKYTVIRQLAEYSHIDLSLTMNGHDASPRPASYKMGPYLYFRLLPPSISKKKILLGFQVNGHDAKYSNCYGRRSNYWALYPNDNNVKPYKGHNVYCNTQPCYTWYTNGVVMNGPQEVPNDMLFYGEMHFGLQGGCGSDLNGFAGFQSFSLAIAVR